MTVSGHAITLTKANLPTLSVTNGTGNYVTSISVNGHAITANRATLPTLSLTDKGTGTYLTGISVDGHAITVTRGSVTIPNITVTNSGSGNAITSITASGHTLTVTKGSTFSLSSHDHNSVYVLKKGDTMTGSLTAPAFYSSSDKMLKMNIKAIDSFDNIPTLKEFDWKENGSHSYGLIAQELEEMGYSELVDTKEDGYKAVNYSAALCLIVGKLQNKITELEKEIKILKEVKNG